MAATANSQNQPTPNSSLTSNLPVVLVHGIWNTAAIFTYLQDYLTSQGLQVYALSMVPNTGDAPIETLAQQVADFVDDSIGSRQPFHLIGFSMGGLVSRYYLQRLCGLTRVKKFISISAPHQGTLLALGSTRKGIKQMRPNSPFLNDLNRDIHRLKAIQVFSFWTPLDLLILPPWHSQLPIGSVQRLNISTHNKMIQDPKGLLAIHQALTQPVAS